MSETALITGASSGIGWELAKHFARDKYRLVLVARSQDKLEQLAAQLRQEHGAEVLVIVKDLGTTSGAGELFQELQSAGVVVDVLVNNAGFGSLGQFDRMPPERLLEMLRLNVVALTELTRLFLPGMLGRRRGKVLNIGSTASFQPGPNATAYYASKAYVLSFSEGLYEELRGTGVTVTCLCPGPTRTGFGSLSEMSNTPVFKLNCMPVEPVAAAGYRAMQRGQRVCVPGVLNWIGTYFGQISPHGITIRLMKLLQPLPRSN